jgi:hypothetical protein
MKVINLAIQKQEKVDANLSKKVRKFLPFATEKADGEASSVAVKVLERILDNQYVLLTNLSLPGLEVPIPMLLIGPPGVWVICTAAVKGVFKATEDSWEMMDDRFRRYRLAKPNLLKRTMSMFNAVRDLLAARELKVERIEPALFLTDPGVHVDMARPIVRIVLVDALERFAFNVLQTREIMDKAGVHQVSRALAGEGHPALEPKTIEDERDAFSFHDTPAEKATPFSPDIVYDRSESAIVGKVPFNKKQLIILGLMVLVNIAVLVTLVVLVLKNT